MFWRKAPSEAAAALFIQVPLRFHPLTAPAVEEGAEKETAV